jgi:hypothetical protein
MRLTNKEGIPATRRACGRCGRLGHLVRTCDRPEKSHAKLGVEVEGWWLHTRWSEVERTAANWHMSGAEDGSLAHDDSEETRRYEFRTRPGSLGEAISQVTAIYPDKCDSSAGMHIHMSFNDVSDISLLASADFLTFFRQRWEAWGTRMGVHRSSDFWERLRGGNDYCKVVTPEMLTGASAGRIVRADRYRQINFCSFARHGTMELRLLPLFRDLKLAISAMEEWVAIVEDFLATVAPLMLAKFDRDLALSFDAVGVYERAISLDDVEGAENRELATELDLDDHAIRNGRGEIRGYIAARREMALEVATPVLPELRETSREVSLPEILPHTPGHRRLFGSVARRLEVQLAAFAEGV